MTLQATEDIELGDQRIRAGEAIPDWFPKDQIPALKASGAIVNVRSERKRSSRKKSTSK